MTYEFKIQGKQGKTIPYKEVVAISSHNSLINNKVVIAFEPTKNINDFFRSFPDDKVALFLTQEMLILSFIGNNQYYGFSLKKEMMETIEIKQEVYFSIMKEKDSQFEVDYVVHYSQIEIL